MLIGYAASHILHMQKALEQMNLKLTEVISDITGWSGMRIIKAILAGQRDPEHLVELCDVQILQRKRASMLEALRGFWRQEHLFALRQALAPNGVSGLAG